MKKQKLKYYLRGLGIGVLVTAFILGFAHKGDGTMTDEQIRARAIELGMVEAGSIMLSDLKDNSDKDAEAVEPTLEILEESTESEETPEASEENSLEESIENTEETKTEESSEKTEESESVEAAEETQVTESVESAEETQVIEPVENTEASEDSDSIESTETSEESETVTLVIRSGASSYSVSKDLVALGLVEDAAEYDKYLCDYGYSRTIRVGTYEITIGADKEEIAKIITGKR